MHNIEDLKKLDFVKNWAGKWSLLECTYFGQQYTVSLKDKYGVGLTHALFSFENGTSANYLVTQETQKLAKHLIKICQAEPDFLESIIDENSKMIDSILVFLRNFRGTPTKADYDKMWQILKNYLPVNYPLKPVANNLSPEELKQILSKLEKVRVKSEPVYAESTEFVKSFASSLASEIDHPVELVLNFTKDELEAFYKNKSLVPESELESRSNFTLLLIVAGNYKVISDESAKSLFNGLMSVKKTISVLKGVSAYKGKVRGKVQVVLDPSKVSKLKPNTVLVTGMTRLDYMHLFKEAVAVVTDAGGVLSHAAITARELKKACVIGTEVATQVLKDGDEVEVDADNGVVRIIKKA